MVVWFATGNVHKRGELAAMLPEADIRIPSDAGLEFDPDENGETFLENALIKARALYGLVNAPVIADDSGLCVDALGGRPGTRSARYGTRDGYVISAEKRNRLLLRELGQAENRRARFVCAMVLMLAKDRFFAAQETLEGEILQEPRGLGGFGFDPIVCLPEHGMTVAELPAETKNALSHRGKAAAAIKTFLARLP
ncbi:MAG: RdgB/HAM1 family non-canonical purine NTP pyrophosphatase [Spirochaetaceae bacterium]|jgi:XTP/dITP diphosphohydrolase|nr:RdgB/HAM1 family non-canonical purine NTP pyrophosphatase [Spirochaetaceae bacterium]